MMQSHPALTPTSTPKEIYVQVSSLKELRHYTTVLEATLAEQKKGSDRGADEDKDGNKGDCHSTCFKLYQAVRSLKKRDNKKEEKERLYSSLEDAFNAHRLKILSGATATHRRVTRSVQHASATAVSASSLVSASSSIPSVPAAVQPSVRDLEANDDGLAVQHRELRQSQSTAHQQSTQQQRQYLSQRHGALDHLEADGAGLPRSAVCTSSLHRTALVGEVVEEMHNLLCQLSDSTSRMQTQLTSFEAESWHLRTQLKSCHELLKVAEAKMPSEAQPVTSTIPSLSLSTSAVSASLCGSSSCIANAFPPAGDTSPPAEGAPPQSSPTPVRTPSPLEGEERMDHEDTAASSAKHGPDAGASQADTQNAARSEESDDDLHGADGVEEPRRTDGPRDAESNDDARHTSSTKRSRSTSEDGEVGSDPKRRVHVPSSGGHADAVMAVAEIADKSVPKTRSVWVQSQCEMSEHDLTIIFSHFGQLERVDVPRPRSGRLPFAFVHFREEEDAKSILRRADDGEFGRLTVKPYHSRREEAWQTVQGSSDRLRNDR